MKPFASILFLVFLTLPYQVIADTPESLAIQEQLIDATLLMEATAAAAALSITTKGETIKENVQIRDCLDELVMRAFHRIAELLYEAPSDQWAHHQTKAQWAGRMITHFLNHHTGSANEGWSVMCQAYLYDQKVTTELFHRLEKEKQDFLLSELRSKLNRYQPDTCREFASALEASRHSKDDTHSPRS